MLIPFVTQSGETLYLCDFGSAGALGTSYRSWLPVALTAGGARQCFAPETVGNG